MTAEAYNALTGMPDVASDFIKAHEGCRLTAYQDSVGVWTIGYGATGFGIEKGVTWTQTQADARLLADIDNVQKKLAELMTRAPNDNQGAALTSLAFNVGAMALAGSHILACFNSGDDLGAAKAFVQWDHAGGKELKGLLIRRLEEAALYLK